MSRTGWIWTAVIVVIIIIAGVWYYNSSTPIDTTSDGTQIATTSSDTTGSATGDVSVGVTAGQNMTVTYDGSSFSPATITVAKGSTVTFLDTAGTFWLASDPHPTHTAYDGTSRTEHCAPGYTGAKPFDECATGSSFSFTFDKTGTFGYHDHMNDEAHGTVVVQ